eukprot:8162481-Heterocapsa_arctica.AAC.1
MIGIRKTPVSEWALLIEIFKVIGKDAHVHNALVGWTALYEFPEDSYLITAGSMAYLEHERAYQVISMGVVVSKGKAIVTLQPH